MNGWGTFFGRRWVSAGMTGWSRRRTTCAAARARAGRPRSPRSRPGAGERLCGGEIPISDERTSRLHNPTPYLPSRDPSRLRGRSCGLVTPLGLPALRPPPAATSFEHCCSCAHKRELWGLAGGNWQQCVGVPASLLPPVGCLETGSPRQISKLQASGHCRCPDLSHHTLTLPPPQQHSATSSNPHPPLPPCLPCVLMATVRSSTASMHVRPHTSPSEATMQ